MAIFLSPASAVFLTFGFNIKIFGSKDDGGTQFNADCIFVQLSLIVDWIVSDFLAIRQGSLGRLRYILKNGLKYLPLYGFYFAQVAILSLWQSHVQQSYTSHDSLFCYSFVCCIIGCCAVVLII